MRCARTVPGRTSSWNEEPPGAPAPSCAGAPGGCGLTGTVRNRKNHRVTASSTAKQVYDGLVLPAAISGHPGLELCNTVAGWGDEDPYDYLQGYEHVVALAASLGLVDGERAVGLRRAAEDDPRPAHRVLAETRRFRSSLYAVLTQDRPDEGDVRRVARTFATAASARTLEHVGSWGSRWHFPADLGLRVPLLALAWQARALVEADEQRQVGRCPGIGCGWLFINQTGRRRWCVMSICGNRAKARRFARRHAQDGP